VYVAISDDGVGGASSASGTAGRGLANMHTRAAALGAELTVADAQPGTTVDLWIPRDPAA
jgi:signal transduction histidine kinase